MNFHLLLAALLLTFFGTFLGCALATWLWTRFVLSYLIRKDILDHPGERSSHDRPTPRGGGIAVTGVTVASWIGLAWWVGETEAVIVPVLLALGLAWLSWQDDQKSLSAGVRFLAHTVAAGLAVSLMPHSGEVFQGLLPPFLDQVVSVLLLVWFINLFNFMDGIDGISGVETLTIGLGLAFSGASGGLFGLAIAGAALGFLILNWHPARIFLGDVGSVPLGLLLGWLLLQAAAEGYWVIALILPLYYLADATITLLKRLVRGEAVWKPHRQHFYQRAHQAGLSHNRIMRRIGAANALLLLLALVSPGHEALALVLAIMVVAGLLFALQTAKP
ncbi:MAG: hypothetical protein A2516_05740 [Alphaproteobacteria bacterium RIFOXYD12_FULL_60_8]|nr:MAG: hypothetical protein A2516_05740 [Alphaproteobacteria bacterium RIFOXYD12_FULL_60_8]